MRILHGSIPMSVAGKLLIYTIKLNVWQTSVIL